MAIDMIEDNELGALSQSRLNGGFVDDDRYSNLFGMKINIQTPFGRIKSGPQKTAEIQAQRGREYGLDPNRASDCNYLEQRLVEIQNKIKFELSKNPNKKARQRYLDPLYGAENAFKDAVSRNQCVEKRQRAEEERAKKETEEAIRRAAADSPQIPQVQVAKGSRTTKIILVGVGIVVLGVIGIALFRKK